MEKSVVFCMDQEVCVRVQSFDIFFEFEALNSSFLRRTKASNSFAFCSLSVYVFLR